MQSSCFSNLFKTDVDFLKRFCSVSIKAISVEKFLNSKAEHRCKFYIWNKKEKHCHLYSIEIHDYDKYCAAIGGPKFPDINKCGWLNQGPKDCQVSKI